MIKSDKLYYFKKISIFFILIPMLLMCMLLCVPTRNSLNNAYAADDVSPSSSDSDSNPTRDYIYSYGNFFVPTAIVDSTNGWVSSAVANVTLSFGYMPQFEGSFIYVPFVRIFGSVTLNGAFTDAFEFDKTLLHVVGDGTSDLDYYTNIQVGSNKYFRFYYSKSTTAPDSTLNQVYLTHLEGSNNYRYNQLYFYDMFSNYFVFSFQISGTSDFAHYTFNQQRYYLDFPDLSSNSYYQSGYNDGYNVGYNDGTDSGYQDGYNVGEDVGYNNGYNAGVESSSDYSFLALIGAVVDAPVNAFTSLLNFEILGFNILSFVTGILTILVIVFVIKLAFGK